MKHLLLSFLFGILISNFGLSSILDIEPVAEWTEYETVDGVKIEYVFQECNSQSVSNQTLVLFRFTNTTNKAVTINWKVKTFRNGSCSNCQSLNKAEFLRSLDLESGEVYEGDCSSKMDKRGYVFSHFIIKTPGMSDSKLTDFELIEIEVSEK
jgi:hypothetical protein